MSNALNLIIARGFGPEVAGLGTAYSDARMTKQRHDTGQRTAEQNLEAGQLGIDAAKGMQADRDEIGQIFDEIQKIEPALNEMRTGARQYPGLAEHAVALNERLKTAIAKQTAQQSPKSMYEILTRQPERPLTAEEAQGIGLRPGTVAVRKSDGGISVLQNPERAREQKQEPLVAIQTPDGPRLMPRSQAVGAVPAQTGGGMRPPPGYSFVDPSNPEAGLRAIPGGPKDVSEKEASKAQGIIAEADNVMSQIDLALQRVDWTNAGLIGSLTSAIPGSPAYDLSKLIDTIKANIGFTKLQQMRDSSPTGGALGQVSERELGFLQATIASLDQAQSPAQLRQSLQRVMQHYQNWRNAVMQDQRGDSQAPMEVQVEWLD